MRSHFIRVRLAASAVLAASTAFSADTNGVVVQVGKQTLALGELQRRWSELPALQRHALGKTDRDALQAYLDRFIVPELLMAEAATEKAAFPAERRARLENTVLQRVLIERIRRDSETRSPITESDVKTYLEAHRQQFDRPERLRLFRILVATEAEARELIEKAHKLADFDSWRNLAREKSLDKATSMRGGELGFVSADGHSDIVELEVDPALFEAAAGVKDGEIVKQPVREKDKFAVVWRRGHVAEYRASLGSVSAVIRSQLREAGAQKAFEELVSQLKAKYVRDVNPNPLEALELPNLAGDRVTAKNKAASSQ